MFQAVDDGKLQAAQSSEQCPTSTELKPKRAKRKTASPALDQVAQHLTRSAAPSQPMLETHQIGLAIDSLKLPKASGRRPPVRCGFTMSYGTSQS